MNLSAETLKFFETIPVCLAVLSPDFILVTASDLYLQVTGKSRIEIKGKNIFEAFPENQGAADAHGAADLKNSLDYVITTKQAHQMSVLRYNVQDPHHPDGFVERYWQPVNTPVLTETGEINYILISVSDITDQVKNERNLSESDERLATTIEELINVNEELHSSLGELSESQESLATLNAELETRIASRTLALSESEAKFRDSTDELLASNEELAASNEELQAINEEVVRAKENEQAAHYKLQEAAETLKLALESAKMGTFKANFISNDIEISDRAKEILGVEVPMKLGLKEAAMWIHPDFKEEMRLSIKNSLGITGGFEEEFMIKPMDGTSPKWVKVTGKASFSQDNVPKTMIGTIIDITKRKKRESLLEYLNNAGEELALALDTSVALQKISELIVPKFADWFTINLVNGDDVELLFIKNADQDYVDWAIEHRKQKPMKVSELTLKGHILRTGESLLIPVVTENIIYAANLDEEQTKLIIQMNLRSSIVVPMKIKNTITGTVNFISTVEGKQYDEEDLNFAKDFAIRIGLALENARLHEQAQQEIKARVEAESKKDEFISVASHELKTPMTTLTASIQMLKRLYTKDPLSVSITKLIDTSDKSASKLGVLVRELLNVSRLEEGQLKLTKSWFKLSQVINECCDHVSLLGTHNLLIEGDIDLEVFADPHRIDQVIVNFINNAVKYSPEFSDIRLLVEQQGNCAKLSVIDKGIGIEEGKMAYLFDRYYRVDTSGVQYSGLGLGLYISAEIIRLHNGEIGVSSEEGKGATFWFTIPIEKR